MMKRSPSTKSLILNKKGLILCEGETERNYFSGFVTYEKNKRKFSGIGVEIYKPKDHSPVGLVKEAKKRIAEAKRDKSPYEFVWIVFDKDGHQNIPQAFSDAQDVKPKINIALSVTCFEYFILMHFIKTTKAFSKCDDVISELKKHFVEYEKSRNLYSDLEERHTTACENSEWLCKMNQDDIDAGKMEYELSSYTNVHLLIAALKKL